MSHDDGEFSISQLFILGGGVVDFGGDDFDIAQKVINKIGLQP